MRRSPTNDSMRCQYFDGILTPRSCVGVSGNFIVEIGIAIANWRCIFIHERGIVQAPRRLPLVGNPGLPGPASKGGRIRTKATEMNRYGKIICTCTACTALLGAEEYAQHRECRAPIVCSRVWLYHAPTPEPTGPWGPNQAMAMGTSTTSSSGASMAPSDLAKLLITFPPS